MILNRTFGNEVIFKWQGKVISNKNEVMIQKESKYYYLSSSRTIVLSPSLRSKKLIKLCYMP